MEPYVKQAIFIGLGLSFVTQFATIFIGIIFGGFRIGSLKRTMEFHIKKDELENFLELFHERRTALGFQAEADETQFIQSGQAHGDFSSFTHAKAKKMLKMDIIELRTDSLRIELTLKYLDPILADTGESAYRDAVLDYVSGKTDEMKVVPNLSHAGMCCFVGVFIALLAAVVTFIKPIKSLELSIPFFCFTSVVLGIIATITILTSRKELKGLLVSILGTFINALLVLIYAVKIGLQTYFPSQF